MWTEYKVVSVCELYIVSVDPSWSFVAVANTDGRDRSRHSHPKWKNPKFNQDWQDCRHVTILFSRTVDDSKKKKIG